MNKWILVVLAAIPLLGCQLGVDKEEETEAEDVTISSSGEVRTISNEDLYSLNVTGSNNILTLEDGISKINITGSDNQITIATDYTVTAITLSGENNLIQWDSELDTSVNSTLIEDIQVLGEGHTIYVDTYYKLEDSSTGSQITGQQVARP